MNSEEFRAAASKITNLIIDYRNSFRSRPVAPNVAPGYLRAIMQRTAPQEREAFDSVLGDIEPLIFSGVTNWHHPQFHAYYPSGSSYPSILADMLSDAIGCVGFSWIASPACTELETVMTDWLCRALALPDFFLFSEQGKGGGVIQGSASEAALMVFIGARDKAVRDMQKSRPDLDSYAALSKLVAYTSDQAHCSIERAAKLAFVRLRQLPTDSKRALRGSQLQQAIEADVQNGLVPILCAATMGTTSSCAFDNLEELGKICDEHQVWMHVDAAYAGSVLLCPELRHLGQGLQYAESFNFNPHKWMQVNFDCSVLWLKDSTNIVEIFNADPIYLKHEFTGLPDYRHWQVPLGRRFRSLKIWFTMRCFGLDGLQQQIRDHISQAKQFESLIKADGRFEIIGEVELGLVCFRFKDSNSKTEQLYKKIREDNRLHLVASKFDDTNIFFIRFVVCSQFSEERDMQFGYDVISELANQI